MNTTNLSAGSGTITNVSSTNVSAGSANLTGVTSTNMNTTNLSAGSGSITNVTATNVVSTNSSIGSFRAGAGTIGGHLVPSANVTYDLGSSSLRWNDLYLSGNTIYLGENNFLLPEILLALKK